MSRQEKDAQSDVASQPHAAKYLEFTQLQELIDYLRERQVGCAYLGDTIRHTPTNLEGVGSVAVYAVVSQDLGDHVAVYGQLIQSEIDVFLRSGSAEMATFRASVQERLAQVKGLLEEQGLEVRPGRWSYQPPYYL